MPRDWMHEDREQAERRARWEARGEDPREDFGQADFSSDYAYDPERRAGFRPSEETSRRDDDYGQADYSTDYAYDPDRGRAYRRFSADDRDYGDRDYGEPERSFDRPRGRYEPDRDRSWMGRAGALFSGRDEPAAHRRRRGPSDRVLWAVIVERLEDQRGLDLRDLDVSVEDGEVTLNGTVRRKEDKRRIEDIADVDGVRNVQNNLRVRDRRWFG